LRPGDLYRDRRAFDFAFELVAAAFRRAAFDFPPSILNFCTYKIGDPQMSTKQIEKTAKAVLVTTTVDTRCLYVSATGRRCRSLAARDTSRPSGLSAFCIPHSQLEQQYVNIKSVSEELLGDADNFQSAVAVNNVLGRLFILQAQNRIPIRNAMALAYTAQVILSTLEPVREEYRNVNDRGSHNEIIETAISRTLRAQAEEDEEQSEEEGEGECEIEGKVEPHQLPETRSEFEAQVNAAVRILDGE
jgi:hypothetical protein